MLNSQDSDAEKQLDAATDDGSLSELHKAFGTTNEEIPDSVQFYATDRETIEPFIDALNSQFDTITTTTSVYDASVVVTTVETIESEGDKLFTRIESKEHYIPVLLVTNDHRAVWENHHVVEYKEYIDDVIESNAPVETIQTRVSTLVDLYTTRFTTKQQEDTIETQEEKLNRRREIITVLQRVLRHNIRNDMAVVKGYSSMVRSEVENTDAVDTINETVDGIVHISERAHEVTQNLASSYEEQHINVKNMVESAKESIDTNGEHTYEYIDVDVSSSTSVNGYPSLETAIVELLENACEYSDDAQITISTETNNNEVTIHVSDNGPGLPNIEQTVLEDGVEEPLEHGSGLGLWVVNWIIQDHNGSIDVETSDDGTTVSLHVPRVQ